MAAIMNKRKVLSVKGKAHGKRKADVCPEIGVVNSVIQMMCKNRTMIIIERNRWRIKGYRKPERRDLIRPCLNACSKREVTMYSELSTVKSLPDSSLVRRQAMVRFSLFFSAMPSKCHDSIAI